MENAYDFTSYLCYYRTVEDSSGIIYHYFRATVMAKNIAGDVLLHFSDALLGYYSTVFDIPRYAPRIIPAGTKTYQFGGGEFEAPAELRLLAIREFMIPLTVLQTPNTPYLIYVEMPTVAHVPIDTADMPQGLRDQAAAALAAGNPWVLPDTSNQFFVPYPAALRYTTGFMPFTRGYTIIFPNLGVSLWAGLTLPAHHFLQPWYPGGVGYGAWHVFLGGAPSLNVLGWFDDWPGAPMISGGPDHPNGQHIDFDNGAGRSFAITPFHPTFDGRPVTWIMVSPVNRMESLEISLPRIEDPAYWFDPRLIGLPDQQPPPRRRRRENLPGRPSDDQQKSDEQKSDDQYQVRCYGNLIDFDDYIDPAAKGLLTGADYRGLYIEHDLITL